MAIQTRHLPGCVALAVAAVMVAGTPVVQATVFTNTTAGDWNVNGNWGGNPFPNAADAVADVTLDFTAGGKTINLATTGTQNITVGALNINDTGASGDAQLTIAPGGTTTNSLTFSVTSGSASLTTASDGVDTVVETDLVLSSNLVVANNNPNASSGVLRLYNSASNTRSINLNANTLTFQDAGARPTAVGTAGGTTNGKITGAGSVVVNRTASSSVQTIFRNSESDYSGGTTLNSGLLIFEADSTGAGAGTTKGALGTGTLTLNQTGANPIRLRSGTTSRTLGNNIVLSSNVILTQASSGASFTLAGGIQLNAANPVITVENTGHTVFVSGVVSHATAGNGFNKQGGGTMQLSGSVSNTYSGTTNVTVGTLELNRTPGVNAIPGNLNIGGGGGAVVKHLASDQIINTGVVSLNGTGVNEGKWQLNSFSETVGGLASATTGIVENGAASGASTLTVSVAGTQSYGGVLRDGAAATLALFKSGAGSQALSNANTYSGGTTINAGTLLVTNVTGSATGSAAVAINAGTLGGNGFITGSVNVGDSGADVAFDATLSPGGSSIDSIDTGALTFAGDGRYLVDLDAGAVTSDVTNVNGLATLGAGTADLAVNLTGSLADGQKYFIIANDELDAVSGTFAGLAQDAIVTTVGSINLKISYAGNLAGGAVTGGNDVVLYAVAIPEPTSLAALASLAVLGLRRRRA